MKIAFVVSQFPLLSESFVVQQITGLLKKGLDVKILSFSQSDQAVTQKDVSQYGLTQKTTYITLPRQKWQLRLKGLWALYICLYYSPKAAYFLLKTFQTTGFSYHDLFFTQFILKHHIQIVHAHFGPNGNLSLILKKIKLPVKLITTFHGYDVTVFVRQHGEHVYDQLFASGDLFTYNSEATKTKLLALGCPEKKMEKLPMALDIEAIPFKERTYKSTDKVRILSVGRLVEMKGREYAIRALALLKENYPFQYDIIGDGILRPALQKLITELGLQDSVKLWGWVGSDQLKECYENAHLFIHPSIVSTDGNSEGQGVVLLEAQAYGIPVIATRHGAFPDSMIDGQTGFLVPEKAVHALAEKIEYLILHSEQWPRIGKAGRDFVEQHFNATMLNNKLFDLYNQTLF